MSATTAADLVYQTSIGTGTGNLTLVSVSYYRTFAAAFPSNSVSARFFYCIRNRSASEWEIGLGYISAGALVRHTVIASSNANALVNFTGGTKDVVNDVPAAYAPNLFEAQTWAGKNTFSDRVVVYKNVDTATLPATLVGYQMSARAASAATGQYSGLIGIGDANGDADYVNAALLAYDDGSTGRQGMAVATGNNAALGLAQKWDADKNSTFFGKIILPAGSAATPSLIWSDTGTGFYRPATDQLSYAIAGVQMFYASATAATFNHYVAAPYFKTTNTQGGASLDTTSQNATVAAGGTVDFVGSGILIVNNTQSSGGVKVWGMGGGSVTAIGTHGTGQGSLAYVAGVAYRWTNDTGAACPFSFCFLKTRAAL